MIRTILSVTLGVGVKEKLPFNRNKGLAEPGSGSGVIILYKMKLNTNTRFEKNTL